MNLRYLLSESISRAIHFYSEEVLLADSSQKTDVTITRTGTFSDPRYGTFDITLGMLQEMVENFDKNVYGQDIALDLSHRPADGAAGYFKSLSIVPFSATIEGELVQGHKLQGRVELTSYGIEAITEKGFVYLSAEFHPSFVSNETSKTYGAVLMGAALTPRPVIKHLDRVSVQLSESSLFGSGPTYIDNTLASYLSEEKPMWKTLIAALQAKLAGFQLSEPLIAQLVLLAETALKPVTDSDVAAVVLAEFEKTGKQLAESSGGSVSLDATAIMAALGSDSGSKGLSESDVANIITKTLESRDKATTDAARLLDEKKGIFNGIIAAAEGLEERDRHSLSEACELINADMSDDQVKALAARELNNVNQLIAARTLAEQGIRVTSPSGVVTLGISSGTEGERLQSIQHGELKKTRQYQNKEIRLSENINPFVTDTLAFFDAQNAQKIHHAVRTLANGETNISDTSLPIGYQREVIRETLSDLTVLDLVAVATDPTATATTNIPYEIRDTSQIRNNGIVTERKAIPKAGVSQRMDLAYVGAMKIAIDVSNEVLHFTRTSGINWDAWARNISVAARLMRELLVARLANMIQRQSDSYQAVSVTSEDIATQVDGSGSIVKTAAYPIVEPFQQYDLQGLAVGNPVNPVTISVSGTEVTMYDGTGEQAAGTYFQIVNHNLGYIQFVDAAGEVATPSHSGGSTEISYSRASNILMVDSDMVGDITRERHLNKLLQAFGSVKATMDSQRYVKPDFALMSSSLHNEVTDAELFSANAKRNDADVSSSGDLLPVKGIPAYSTNAPNINLGDERIILGRQKIASYTIAKPYSFSEMLEARNAQGQLIGAKEAYGEEYNALHIPKPLQNNFMSVLWYSASGR